jgi:hypothetical protein
VFLEGPHSQASRAECFEAAGIVTIGIGPEDHMVRWFSLSMLKLKEKDTCNLEHLF